MVFVHLVYDQLQPKRLASLFIHFTSDRYGPTTFPTDYFHWLLLMGNRIPGSQLSEADTKQLCKKYYDHA